MNINIEEKDYNLHVFVTMSSRARDEVNKACTTQTVLDWLKDNHSNYTIVGTAKSPHRYLHNALGTHRLSGEWIFELERPKTPDVKPVIVVKKEIKPKVAKKATKPKVAKKTTKSEG